MSINNADIEHRIGKMRDAGQNRDLPMLNSSGKKIKRKNISFTESLAATRIKKLNKAREIYDFKNVRTSDGKTMFRDRPGNTSLFYD